MRLTVCERECDTHREPERWMKTFLTCRRRSTVQLTAYKVWPWISLLLFGVTVQQSKNPPAINLRKGGTQGKRKIEGEKEGGEMKKGVGKEIEEPIKEDCLFSSSNYWKTTATSRSFMCYTSLSLVPGHVGIHLVSKSICNILEKSLWKHTLSIIVNMTPRQMFSRVFCVFLFLCNNDVLLTKSSMFHGNTFSNQCVF